MLGRGVRGGEGGGLGGVQFRDEAAGRIDTGWERVPLGLVGEGSWWVAAVRGGICVDGLKERDLLIAHASNSIAGTRRRSDVVRQLEASDTTVLAVGPGRSSGGVTVNGANHLLTLHLEWSPETKL